MKKMKIPKAVLFDYGGTLFNDGEPHLPDAVKALRLAADNPEATTDDELLSLTKNLWSRLKQNENGSDVDIQLTSMIENITKQAGLHYSISLEECGIIFDMNHCSERRPVSNIAGLLEALKAKEIRTAVISNTVMSGIQMKASISTLMPESNFEFVYTSADLVFKKPCGDMFLAAAKNMGLKPCDCWYCGDSFNNDVIGSSKAGMFPVFYNEQAEKGSELTKINSIECFVINDWAELTKMIEAL